MTTQRYVGLDDPDRADIIAEIRGELPLGKRPNRLNNVAQPTVVDDHLFPSRKEANRYAELKLAERAGCISHLRLQVTIPLVVNGIAIFPQGYRSDFIYLERQNDEWTSWKLVIEDAKGVRTEVYQIKAKLVEAIYGIKIRET